MVSATLFSTSHYYYYYYCYYYDYDYYDYYDYYYYYYDAWSPDSFFHISSMSSKALCPAAPPRGVSRAALGI